MTSITLCLALQAVDLEKWNTVPRLCGKAEWVDKVPDKKATNAYSERTKAIRKAKIRLYHRAENVSCCAMESLVSESTTGRDGNFKLEAQGNGKYWVVLLAGGQEYSLPVTLVADAKTREETTCSSLLYDVAEGKLQLRKTITLD